MLSSPHKIGTKTSTPLGVLVLVFYTLFISAQGQQVKWAKVYRLPKTDNINCITKDQSFIYSGGSTRRNAPGSSYTKAILYKLDLNGDTVFIKDLGIHGTIASMTVDQEGFLRVNVEQTYFGPWYAYRNFLIKMNSEGIPLKIDTIPRYTLNACTMGKDSSLVVVGSKRTTGGSVDARSIYFWRMNKYRVLDPWVELNPGTADRVEQLPNGHYLISGRRGSRAVTCEVDSVGGNPQYHEWYQTPDSSLISSGYVGLLGKKNWMVAGQAGPCFVGVYDSTKNKTWIKKEVGALAPPLAMKDTSIVFGYASPTPPHNFYYRFGADSSLKWYFNMRDSLTQRGLPGAVYVVSYAFFEDESAVFAGTYNDDIGVPGDTGEDPIFMRIANVGTPVSVLEKPKSGTLQNETLAPWPNPTGGTLYLKQHFDKAEIHFYNISGKEMGQYQIRFGQSIDISQYSHGVYFYRAVIDGKSFTGKVVKN